MQRRILRSREFVVVLGLVAVGIVAPVLFMASTHSLGIAHNDDWAYRRSALQFSSTGHLAFAGWTVTTLVFLLAWSWPFLHILGSHQGTLAVSTAVLGAFGLAGAYYVARSWLSRVGAAVAVLSVIAFPGFAFNTATYMTDVPSFALQAVCLAFGVVATRRTGRAHWAWLAASLAVGCAGFATRDFAVAAPLSVAAVMLWTGERRDRTAHLAAAAAAGIVCIAVYVWTNGISGQARAPLSAPGKLSVIHVVQGFFTLAFFVSPLVFAVAARRLRTFRPLAIGSGAVTVAVGLGLHAGHYQQFVGNVLMQSGIAGTDTLAGARPALFPSPVWQFLELVGLAAGGLLTAVVVTSIPDIRRLKAYLGDLIVVFTVISAAVLIGFGLLSGMFDRYLWPCGFGVAVLLAADLRGVRRHWGYPVAAAVAVFLVATSGALTLNEASYDAARWHAGHVAVADGVPISEVDAGFEWVGLNTSERVTPDLKISKPAYERFYAGFFPGFKACAVVSGSPLSDPTLTLRQVVQYNLLAVAVKRPLYIYLVQRC